MFIDTSTIFDTTKLERHIWRQFIVIEDNIKVYQTKIFFQCNFTLNRLSSKMSQLNKSLIIEKTLDLSHVLTSKHNCIPCAYDLAKDGSKICHVAESIPRVFSMSQAQRSSFLFPPVPEGFLLSTLKSHRFQQTDWPDITSAQNYAPKLSWFSDMFFSTRLALDWNDVTMEFSLFFRFLCIWWVKLKPIKQETFKCSIKISTAKTIWHQTIQKMGRYRMAIWVFLKCYHWIYWIQWQKYLSLQ